MEQQNYWQAAFAKYLTDHGIPYEIPINTTDVNLSFPGNYLPNLRVKVLFNKEKENYLYLMFRYDWSFDDAKERNFQVPEASVDEAYSRCVSFNKELHHVRFSLNPNREIRLNAGYYFAKKIDLDYLYKLVTIIAASADFVYPVLLSRFGIGQPKTGGAG